jgi:O-antigen ligase
VLKAAQPLLIVALVWGAFAFGAVYPWAYWPLAAASVLVAACAFTSGRAVRSRPLMVLATALCLVGAAIAVQLVPLSLGTLAALSPGTVRALGQLNPAVAVQAVSRHPISLDAGLTARGLTLFAANAMLMLGCARLFSFRGSRRFAEALTVVGAALALTGMMQQPLFAGKIYGFWTSFDGGDSYGPFVNRNHFAGWMLMALPVTLGLLCAGTARGLAGIKPTWRDRLLWLSSPEANRLILLAAAAAVMALALVLTMSRSGISALAVSVVVTSSFVLWRQRGVRRGLTLAYLGMLVVVVVGWAGADLIAARFSNANWDGINGRRGAWSDAAAVAKRFPLTGSGLDTYGLTMVLYQQHDMMQSYTEAHNDYLQLAAEGGALVVVPAVLALVAFAVAVRRRFAEEISTTAYWLRLGAVTGLLAIALQETVEFSLQMPGNAVLFAAVCGIALHRTPSRSLNSKV